MNADEWHEIIELQRSGESISGIAKRLRISRNTVRRALTFETPPRDHRPRSGSSADALVPAIEAALAADPDMSIAQLHRELEWGGSRNTLASVVRRVREASAGRARRQASTAADIPQFATTFVGRTDELTSIRTLLGKSRLVTITGPGGIGKTRLAATAATAYRRAFSDGVRFVELAALRNESLLPQTILDALGLDEHNGPWHSATDSVIESVRHKQMLIVLDNCEHLVSACAELISLILRHTTHVKILVTSREVLSTPGEHVHVLEPLSTTDDRDPDGTGAAMELFENRASAALCGFAITDASRDAVLRVCTQLDGMPLAIELACARLSALSVDDLANRLDDRLALLTVGNRGGPDRHRSLHATVEWSYELCTPQEQVLWTRLSVFAEGFDLPMAENVCATDPIDATTVLDALTGLIGKSVVQRGTGGRTVRFRMLETIRHFGASKLSETDSARLRAAHLRWSAGLIRSARESWTGDGQARASDRLRENRANIRAALHNALVAGERESIASASDMVATWFLWSSAMSVREHRLWITELLRRDNLPDTVRPRLSATLGLLHTMQGERGDADRILLDAGRAARERGDDATLAFVLQTRGLNTYLGGDFDGGEHLLTAALRLYETLPIIDLKWTAHIEMGMLFSSNGQIARASEHFEFVHTAASATGEKWMLSYAVYGRGLVALGRGDHTQAAKRATESFALKRAFDDTVGATLVTDLLAWAEAASGSGERAAVLLGAASSMWDSFGMQLYGSQHWVQRRAMYAARARKSLGESVYRESHHRGESLTMAQLIAYALDEENDDGRRSSSRSSADAFSPREREIAQCVADGLSNRQIAERLILSVRTVEGHVARLLRKLEIERRQQISIAITGGRPA
ncbi:LuxR family transcriptional regulator [Nocardia callitridis]|uniref:LuxR family transcriptional regulator n=1 Tax=Nocardia callitridis TaxID=648753 RepID=A0ABP9KTL3_9NOCA